VKREVSRQGGRGGWPERARWKSDGEDEGEEREKGGWERKSRERRRGAREM
jgi:hypothetical protein